MSPRQQFSEDYVLTELTFGGDLIPPSVNAANTSILHNLKMIADSSSL